MYRHCIFCSAELGANEALEAFPVGRSLAFDAGRGRLWAVCPKCARWNLAPIEERWEAIEAAERLFADTRLRAQRENIGLAKLRDGTRLVRVGDVLPGELAAWRYGGQLVQRRKRHLVGGAAVTVGAVAVLGGLSAAGVAIGGSTLWFAKAGHDLWEAQRSKRVVARLLDPARPGVEVPVRRWQVKAGKLDLARDDGTVRLYLPERIPFLAKMLGIKRPGIAVAGRAVEKVLSRGMVHVNDSGASAGDVQKAVQLLEKVGTGEDYLRHVAEHRGVLDRSADRTRRLTRPGKLALEMALHEEQERRALEGELALLEAAWREAEEIAAIADALPDDPPPTPRLGAASTEG